MGHNTPNINDEVLSLGLNKLVTVSINRKQPNPDNMPAFNEKKKTRKKLQYQNLKGFA